MRTQGPNEATWRSALALDANPELRDHLLEIYKAGSASKTDLDLIPLLAGKLSEAEEKAILFTLDHIDRVEDSPGFRSYLEQARQARGDAIAELDEEGLALYNMTKQVTKISAAVGGAVTLGLLISGSFMLAASVPFAACMAPLLASVYGFSAAGVVDQKIRGYGVYD